MPNFLPTPSIIADKMLEYIFEGSDVVNNVNRDYETQFEMDKQSVGRTIQVKNPARFYSQNGPVISSVQPINHGLTPFSIDQWKTVPVKITGLERTFSNSKELDVWANENIKPLVSPLISDVEIAIGDLYNKISNHVGTPGTGPTTYDPMGAAREKLSLFRTPVEDRLCYLHPSGSRKLGNGLSNNFNPQQEIGKQYKTGVIAPIAGFDMKEGNFLPTHTNGSVTSTGANVLTNGTDQVGSSIAVDAFTTGKTYAKGDVITFADVYAVDPVTLRSTGQLRQFVITAAVTAAGNAATLSVSPAVIPSGAFKNIIAADNTDLAGIPDGKAVTLVSGTVSTSYAQNLAWWKKAIGLVTVPIAPLEGVKSVTRTHQGISLTFSMAGDIMNFETIKRIDMAFGVNVFYMDQVVRITN